MFQTIANSNDSSEYVSESKMWSSPQIIESFIPDFFDYQTPLSSSEFTRTNISDYHRYTACSKWTFNQTYYQKTIVTDFGLVCEDAWKIQIIQIFVMIGVFFGAVVFGKMSDNSGRMRTVTVSLITAFFGLVSCAFVPKSETGFYLLLLGRMFSGAGSIGAISSAFVMTSEIFEPKTRVMALQVAQALFGVGQAIMALLAYWFPTWRVLAVIMSLPAAIGFFIPKIFQESARWLISQGRIAEANAALEIIAKINGRTFGGLEKYGLTQSAEKEAVVESSLSDFFATPRIRMRTLNLFYQWFMLSGVYYGLSMGATTLGGNPFVNLAISGMLEVPAELLAGFLFVTVGRRWSMFFFDILGGVSCLAMMFIHPEQDDFHRQMSIVLPLAGKFALTGAYGGIYVYSAELFPTALRNTGIGLCSSVARIGGICAPIVALLAVVNPSLPYIIFGVLGLTGAFLTLLLEETLDKVLPDTVEQGEKFGVGEPGAVADLKLTCARLLTEIKFALCRTPDSVTKYRQQIQNES
ncbi:Oidioi.mRNA.OKI2018_I69.chr2.g4136.t1.cds [Oikopleura dioica]|uniref:Oidioi.mRNA.OKI2018_I69.chr2.g4136.t1.cds n=1 Tax=Oikopleura dioica TaxID=34765 RepID=A0ABN7SW65_OIKDI|nr:Oidioi.mRNA.OKI2018_I69.chr2.g4136.t1.cds [Oikopleura dioica]